jgi:hypothetical protein
MFLDSGFDCGFTHGVGREDVWSKWNSGLTFVERGLRPAHGLMLEMEGRRNRDLPFDGEVEVDVCIW